VVRAYSYWCVLLIELNQTSVSFVLYRPVYTFFFRVILIVLCFLL